MRILPGAAAAAALAALATLAGNALPIIGAPALAVLAGTSLALWRAPSPQLAPGLAFVSKYVLQGSVVLLGLGLSLRQVLSTGLSSFPVLIGTLLTALAVSQVAGGLLGLKADLRALIGVGTAICGASAIAATDAVIGAAEGDVSYAIATIFAFNVVAVVAYPALGHLVHLSQKAFGLWAGTAINDTSSVVAAGNVYGHVAATTGVIVKLTRTLAIVPVCLAIAFMRNRRPHAPPSPSPKYLGAASERRPGPLKAGALQVHRAFPLFIFAFLAAVIASSSGLVPARAHQGLSDLAGWSITAALAAIGLSTEPRLLRSAGPRPLVLGGILWATVGLTSLALQAVTGTI